MARLTDWSDWRFCQSEVLQRTKQHELSPVITNWQSVDAKKLENIIDECNPFFQENEILMNIITKAVMSEDVTQDIVLADEVGEQCHGNFVEQRVKFRASIWDKMSKVNLLTWKSASTTPLSNYLHPHGTTTGLIPVYQTLHQCKISKLILKRQWDCMSSHVSLDLFSPVKAVSWCLKTKASLWLFLRTAQDMTFLH